jgi:alpha-mannosidase
MKDKLLFLLCNAHLDPVWLWEWGEGAAEALSTFRTAARLCDEFEEFVFNHNEALLYQWVEQNEPELFARIKELVANQKWHVMGGWYVQPDCNMPCGESMVRQILAGKRYFKKHFGAEPGTAINLDPFGHGRGLVQILKKAGYSSYLFCRPDPEWLSLPGEDFVWVGYDGSEILAHRAGEHYNSQMGKAVHRVKKWLKDNTGRTVGILLWGIGDHGGGPSRRDLKRLRKLMAENKQWDIRHGTPEEYFTALKTLTKTLPRYAGSLNPWAVGCYTSMALAKKAHRSLENMYYLTEKMACHAALSGSMTYPRESLREAIQDLLIGEFHDVLPGSSIPEVEEYARQIMGHGMEILSRLQMRYFFSLLGGRSPSKGNAYPIFVYNPHPFPLEQTVVCELQPPEPLFDQTSTLVPVVRNGQGKIVASQMEKETSTLSVEWRKKVAFRAKLKPSSMNLFVCRLKKKPRESKDFPPEKPLIVLRSDCAELAIRTSTGWVEHFRIKNRDFLTGRAFQMLVMEDSPDSWGMKVRSFRKYEGKFSLLSDQESARFAGVSSSRLKPVRIIEDGPVRTVVEALFGYNKSFICQRYIFPKRRSSFEVEIRVFWNEKDRMLKLAVPTAFKNGLCRGQVAYGVEEFQAAEYERVAQKWLGVISADDGLAFTVINDRTYGFDFKGGELRLSLLRSPAYAADTGTGWSLVSQDRFIPRMDQGERIFRFWIDGGNVSERLAQVDREALARNEAPLALCCFPPEGKEEVLPGVVLSGKAIQATAVKMAEEREWLILRLFEPTGKKRKTKVALPLLSLEFDVSLSAFEIKSLAVDLRTKEVFEVDLMERRTGKQKLLFSPR